MYFLEISVEFDSKQQGLRFFKSIKPELDQEYFRSKIKVIQKEKKLIFLISAQDKTALRASFNSIKKPLLLFNQIEGMNESF